MSHFKADPKLGIVPTLLKMHFAEYLLLALFLQAPHFTVRSQKCSNLYLWLSIKTPSFCFVSHFRNNETDR